MSLLTVAGDAAHDTASPNRNLAPVSTSIDGAGRLCVGGRALSALAAEFGTPLYVMDERSLRRSMQQYRQVRWPRAQDIRK